MERELTQDELEAIEAAKANAADAELLEYYRESVIAAIQDKADQIVAGEHWALLDDRGGVAIRNHPSPACVSIPLSYETSDGEIDAEACVDAAIDQLA